LLVWTVPLKYMANTSSATSSATCCSTCVATCGQCESTIRKVRPSPKKPRWPPSLRSATYSIHLHALANYRFGVRASQSRACYRSISIYPGIVTIISAVLYWLLLHNWSHSVKVIVCWPCRAESSHPDKNLDLLTGNVNWAELCRRKRVACTHESCGHGGNQSEGSKSRATPGSCKTNMESQLAMS